MTSSPLKREGASQQFMERLIRDRAVRPVDPHAPGLPPEERRSWWEFCLGMFEFLQELIRHRLVDRDQTYQLSPLQWTLLKGTYVFATRDAALRAEQQRYAQLCINIVAAFAVIVDDPVELHDMCQEVYCLGPVKHPALAEALVVNLLQGWKDWRDAESPIAWVKDIASSIHERDHTHGGYIRESDALYRTPESNVTPTTESPAFDYQERAGHRDVVRLEEVAELPGEAQAALSSRYCWMGVSALIAAVQDDEDLHAYMKLRLQGHKPRAAWERLRWATNRGQAVDRRFRRLRQKLKTSGFEYQGREIERTRGLSDASCTVVKERLRIPVPQASGATLSGRIVYEPRSTHGETTNFGETIETKQ